MHFHPAGRLVALFALTLLGAGCAAGVAQPVAPQQAAGSIVADGLLLSASTRVWGAPAESIAVSVRVLNQRFDTAVVSFGACALRPTLVREDARTGWLAHADARHWDAGRQTFAVQQLDGHVVRMSLGCPLYLATAPLAPGDSLSPREFTWRTALAEVRGDSLRGAYRAVARLTLRDRTYDVPAGVVWLR